MSGVLAVDKADRVDRLTLDVSCSRNCCWISFVKCKILANSQPQSFGGDALYIGLKFSYFRR